MKKKRLFTVRQARRQYDTVLFAPRAPALNLLTARGGLETTFQTKK